MRKWDHPGGETAVAYTPPLIRHYVNHEMPQLNYESNQRLPGLHTFIPVMAKASLVGQSIYTVKKKFLGLKTYGIVLHIKGKTYVI